MRAPRFWWRRAPGTLAWLLWPLGWLYGAITLRGMQGAGSEAGVPVICVGNFVAGGAGKTPTAMAIAALLTQRGETPFVLMRGYGGALAGPVEVDPAHHAASNVGDEPLLMARHVRTIVARDRPAGAAFARAFGASVIVLDDGLQNPALTKKLRLAVVDGASGVGNGLCIPAGPLRAPVAGQLAATDAVIIIGPGAAGEAVAAMARLHGVAVFKARLEPAAEALARLKDRSVIAVAGIGRPEKFTVTLREAGAHVAAERAFADHHAYGAVDVAEMLADARARNCLIATTEKDFTKLGPLWPQGERERLVVVPVTLVFEEPAQIAAIVAAASGPAGAAQP